MSKRTLRALIVVGSLVAVGPAIPADVVSAVSVDEARRDVERIVDELDRLAERSDRLTEDYAEAVDDKGRLEVEVAEAEERVAEMEARLAELRDDLSAVAVRQYTGAGNDVLGPLFTDAAVYNETLQRDQFSRVALSVGTTTTNDYETLLLELDAERAELDRMRAQVEALAVQLEGQLEEAEALRVEYQQRRVQAEADLGAALAAEEQRRLEEAQRRMQAEAAEAQRRAEAQAAASASASSTASSNSSSTSSSDSSSAPAPAAAPAAPAAPASNAPAPSSLAGVAVNAALGQQGVPYRFATSSPGVSFDCSGLTHYAWGQAGVYLPRNSRAQAAALPRIPPSQAQAGDLIFYYSPISHVGIYLGGGQLVHAPNTGSVVNVTTVNWSRVTAVGRPG